MIMACTSPAAKGKANKTVIRMLSDFFNVSNNCVNIISGFKSRKKTVQIIADDEISPDSLIKKLMDAVNAQNRNNM